MTEPPSVAGEIRLTRWTSGEWSVTEDHGSHGETVTVESKREALERVHGETVTVESKREALERVAEALDVETRDTHRIECRECDAYIVVYMDEAVLDLSGWEDGWRFNTDEGWTCPEHGDWHGVTDREATE